MRTFATEWNEFRDEVLPSDASSTQKSEMRKAFYSGALALISLLYSDLSKGVEATEQDVLDFDELVREITKVCESFGKI